MANSQITTIMTDDDYKAGKRAAQIEELKGQVKELWQEIKQLRGWQNRTIGYAVGVGTILSLIIQYGIKKFGG